MTPAFEDQFTEHRRGHADGGSLAAEALDGPVGEAPVARRHVLVDGGWLVVAGVALMRSDTLALAEHLHRARRDPCAGALHWRSDRARYR